MLLKAENITLSRDRRGVLSGISLEIRAGEVVSLIGPNGAGKTSLLQVLLKLLPPSSGTVTHAPELRIGYLPQRLQPDPMLPLTVTDFLNLWPGRDNAGAALEQAGASPLQQRHLARLSGGEWQRVLLARALLNKPNLLVLDEPAQGLDVHGQAALYDLVGTLRDSTGCAVLMVSHDLHVVMAKTDRVLCLNTHICCEGHPEAVSRDPAYLALFGTSAAAFALYHHHHDHTHDGAVRCNHPDHQHHG
jgi:zinc transport system ATP-binding protein